MTIFTPRKTPKYMAEALKRAAHGERVIIKRRGKPNVAVVPIEDAEYMQRLEDAHDIAAAQKARKETGFIPWEDIKKKHRL